MKSPLYDIIRGTQKQRLTPEDLAAQIWCRPENGNREMDIDFALSIAATIREYFGMPTYEEKPEVLLESK